MDNTEDRWILRSGIQTLDCRKERVGPPHVMGILNLTPDSFYDGGVFNSIELAVSRADEMVSEGAAIIDVGGASSRPKGSVYGEGAAIVSPDDEIERVVPVISAISKNFPSVWISIDTYLPIVAREAIQAGAHLINDITGLRLHPELASVASESGVPMILMHSIGRPGEMPHAVDHDDVVDVVHRSLAESIQTAEVQDVQQIVIDPGFGFGKTVQDNLRLIGELHRFQSLNRPVLVGISRKSSIGSVLSKNTTPVPVQERLFGSLGATAVAAIQGAAIVRTHDVRPTVEMLNLLSATFSVRK